MECDVPTAACAAQSAARAPDLKLGRAPRLRRSFGFSVIELAVVVIVIGVLAAFGLPRMFISIERCKAGEAFKYLNSIQASQERYQALHGTYANDLANLDVEQNAPAYFTVGVPTPGGTGVLTDSWSVTLTRQGASSGYGAYTVTFTEHGFDAASSTISSLDSINPMNTY